jgi:hypothetical protein
MWARVVGVRRVARAREPVASELGFPIGQWVGSGSYELEGPAIVPLNEQSHDCHLVGATSRYLPPESSDAGGLYPAHSRVGKAGRNGAKEHRVLLDITCMVRQCVEAGHHIKLKGVLKASRTLAT